MMVSSPASYLLDECKFVRVHKAHLRKAIRAACRTEDDRRRQEEGRDTLAQYIHTQPASQCGMMPTHLYQYIIISSLTASDWWLMTIGRGPLVKVIIRELVY